MIDAWGETHITHYMVSSFCFHIISINCNEFYTENFALCLQHSLYAHGPWFMKKYGSLAIWNTQGMEKSHYKAKAFKNSRHGGGKGLSNALVHIFQWFYRGVLSRQCDKDVGLSSMLSSSNSKRRTAWMSSNASTRHTQWRMSRVRIGNRWLPSQIASSELDVLQS